MTQFVQGGTCFTCKWWDPYEGSETGVCRSVIENDYASADLVRDAGTDVGCLLQTYASFGCVDYQSSGRNE